MNVTPADGLDKFHLSLNVINLARSLEFYKTLFDLEPAKSFPDYAKFELVDPPVIMSLVPRAPSAGTQSCGFGILMPDRASVLKARDRIEKAGLKTQTQECTRCGYTEQLRVHVGDPDGNYWSLYAIDKHVDPKDIRQSEDGIAVAQTALPEPSVKAWEHFATHPLPDRIPCDDESLDEVRLIGSFNQIDDSTRQDALLKEAARVLKPGGTLQVSGLMADKPFPNGEPALKNVAIVIKRITIADEVLGFLRTAGFQGIEMVNSKESTQRFTYDGVRLGEGRIRAVKPERNTPSEKDRFVFYKGPFVQTRDDLGNVYHRGRRMPVDAQAWNLLRRGAAAEQFVFLDPNAHESEDGTCSV